MHMCCQELFHLLVALWFLDLKGVVPVSTSNEQIPAISPHLMLAAGRWFSLSFSISQCLSVLPVGPMCSAPCNLCACFLPAYTCSCVLSLHFTSVFLSQIYSALFILPSVHSLISLGRFTGFYILWFIWIFLFFVVLVTCVVSLINHIYFYIILSLVFSVQIYTYLVTTALQDASPWVF